MNFLKELQLWNPGLVEMMRNCSHHFSPTDINSYHVENDVFTHICLTYKMAEVYNSSLLMKLICTIHDLGKVYCRYVDSGKVKMSGHEFAIQDAIDFLYYLKEKDSSININEITLYQVLTIISNHMNILSKNMSQESKLLLCNKDRFLLELAAEFSNLDSQGSITESEKMGYAPDEIQRYKCVNFGYPDVSNLFDCDIIFMCGIPGSGKDFIASKYYPDAKIVSFDNIRVEIFKDSLNGEYQGSEAELYQDAFDYVNKKKINLNPYLQEDVEKAFSEGYEQVIISNTNLTRKRRKGLVNLLKGKNRKAGACFVTTDFQTAFERNNKRTTKQIPKNVIFSFSLNQQVPTMFDGFDKIKFVMN